MTWRRLVIAFAAWLALGLTPWVPLWVPVALADTAVTVFAGVWLWRGYRRAWRWFAS